MLPQIKFHETLYFHSIAQFFNHSTQNKNLGAIKELHAHLLRAGLFFISPNLQTKLVSSYMECCNDDKLKTLSRFLRGLCFRNSLPFNSMIAHFTQQGLDNFSLHALSFMHSNSVNLDSYALCSSIKSASCLKRIWFAKMMQAYVEKSGWLSSVFVGSALVDFYAKSLCVNLAAKVFDEIPVKNIVCMNALLSGFAEAKLWEQVIELIRKMPLWGFSADNFTFSAALGACSGMCALELGKQVHANVVRCIIDVRRDVFLKSLLIEMYGKCGQPDKAKQIFDTVGYGTKEGQHDVVLWTSLLGVYGRAGDYAEVIRLFNDMVTEGIKPDSVAFLTVISACSHTGQVDLGLKYFDSMIHDYGLVASQEHYSCVVDLVCRGGELERACKFVSERACRYEECAVSMWGALLSACVECGNVKLGKLVAERALEVDPGNAGIYVMLSNLYGRNEMWGEIEELRKVMKGRGLKKDLGWSWIEM